MWLLNADSSPDTARKTKISGLDHTWGQFPISALWREGGLCILLFRKEWGREVRGYSLEEEEEEAAGVPFKWREAERYMQIGPKGHLNGLQTEWLKGCCWVVITKHEIPSQAWWDAQAQPCDPGRELWCGRVLTVIQRCCCRVKIRLKADAASAPAPAPATFLIHCGRQEVSLKISASLHTATHLPMWTGERLQLRSGSRGRIIIKKKQTRHEKTSFDYPQLTFVSDLLLS